jgi:alpha-N-arabinofuranosidase
MQLTPVVLSTALVLVVGPFGQAADGASAAGPGTTIGVTVDGSRGRAPTMLLGANHHFHRNGYGLWDPHTDAPVPAVVAGAERVGLQSMRFPGGTVANLYDWKRAIGPRHGCQVVGPQPGKPAEALTRGLAFGPDEFMRFLDIVDAKPLIMVPFVTETPRDAADWVEYMNAPAGSPGNPHGGTDWADVRSANGHRAPYRVHWWEIGNEQHFPGSRYWMSHNTGRALRQYTFGGARSIRNELLGKDCAHPRAGVRSDGTAAQTFEALYPPIAPSSLRVAIGRQAWHLVPRLSAAASAARVFTLDASTGRIRFGDGTHGAVPPRGSTVRAAYRSVHRGYFAFARAMREVDPSIGVCASWGTPAFNRIIRHRRYDCLTAHAISVFTSNGPRATWSGPLEGHDQFMLRSEAIPARIRALRHSMPRSTPLLLTEFVTLLGDPHAFPTWASSVSHAVYMSSLWAAWLKMRIPWGDGDDFLWASDRAVLGPAPHYTFTADAVTRQAIAPMFSTGGALLATRISGNPIRHPPRPGGSYPGLVVAATRGDGVVRLLVVNRLPRSGVDATIRLRGGRARGTVAIRSVTGSSFRSRNEPSAPHRVVLRTRSRPVRATGFHHMFPAASTTVLRIPLH